MALAIFCIMMVFPVRGGGHDDGPLTLPDGAEEIDNPGGNVSGNGFQIQQFIGVQGRKVVKGDAVLGHRGIVIVDGLYPEHGEKPLLFLGAANLTVYGVPGF
jgi:hypothetical protein